MPLFKDNTNLVQAFSSLHMKARWQPVSQSVDARRTAVTVTGLLHAWSTQDCSLYTNELVYSPPSAPHASSWPGLVGGTSASMNLVAGPPVPTSEVAFRALQTLREASVGTAAHRGDTERATASRTA